MELFEKTVKKSRIVSTKTFIFHASLGSEYASAAISYLLVIKRNQNTHFVGERILYNTNLH